MKHFIKKIKHKLNRFMKGKIEKGAYIDLQKITIVDGAMFLDIIVSHEDKKIRNTKMCIYLKI